MRSTAIILAAASILVAGCSTRPREYTAVLAAPPADSAAYERDLADCRAMVASGKQSGFGEAVLATGTGTAAGYAAGAATIGTGVVPMGIGMSAAAGLAVLSIMPVAGIFAGVGVTKAIRKGKEKKINATLGDCLAARGHSVSSWELARKAPRNSPAEASPQ